MCECGCACLCENVIFFVLAAVVLIVILTFPCFCWSVSSKVIAQWHFIVKSNASKTYAHSLLYRKWKVLLIFTDFFFFLPRGKMNQFCFWRFLPSNQTLPPCWCIIGESVLFFSSSSTSILLLIQKSWLLTSVAFPPHIKTGVYRETIQWAAVLCENILLMSEENGQSVSS